MTPGMFPSKNSQHFNFIVDAIRRDTKNESKIIFSTKSGNVGALATKRVFQLERERERKKEMPDPLILCKQEN